MNFNFPQDGRHSQTYPEHRREEFNYWKAIQSILFCAIAAATLFTMWSPGNVFSTHFFERMAEVIQKKKQPVIPFMPTSAPVQPKLKIGIVAGHWGNDSGSVCDDCLTEAEVNLRLATLVKQKLIEQGYTVDLLQEFDKNLTGYQAAALVSIHNDSCNYISDDATGFKVAAAMSNPFPEKASRLTACMNQRYQSITGLKPHPSTITPDMTSYHAFNEVNRQTTAAIIETGFLNLDRQILTGNPDMVANGITAGILCFLRNENIPQQPGVN